MTMHNRLSLALLLAPFALASSGVLPPLERAAKHRELAMRAGAGSPSLLARAASTSSAANSDITPGAFQIVGNSGVSAQMMFLGTTNTVYMLDKAENNSMTVTSSDGETHPAWGTSYDLSTNVATPMVVGSNTFCAGGTTLANGSWVVFGGNQAVTYNGTAVDSKIYNPTGTNPYDNSDGGAAIRMLDPCDDDNCAWQEGSAALTMTGNRWYPAVEKLGDGSVIILGGDKNGGYVSTTVQNNPTYEYFPQKSSGAINMNFLSETVPLNLYPLTWLMPGGKLFMQAAYKTIMYDMTTKVETPLPDMPYAVRVYPASAATVMLPLTPANNYTPTLLFCGGSSASFATASDAGSGINITAVPADNTCVRISPEAANPEYTDDDNLPEARSMGNFIYLPDGTLWLGNGVGMGTAGYGNEMWSFGQSYGQEPVYEPAIYDPNAPSGSRFSRTGLSASTQERMYHSSAVLLADGAVLVSGSNPNSDVVLTKWPTNYAVEKWYPLWYNMARPTPSGFPDALYYGGEAWNLTYTPTNSSSDPSNTKVVVIRTGFSTHCMNFGQRYLELSTAFTKASDTGLVTMYVSQMPPNSNIFQPGPAMIFLVVDGIPSEGQMITIGSGAIETQTLGDPSVLPTSRVIVSASTNKSTNNSTNSSDSSSSTTGSGSAATSGASAGLMPSLSLAVLAIFGAVATFA